MKNTNLILILLILLPASLLAKVNTDSIFSVAMDFGKSSQYRLALQEAGKALEYDQSRGDILIYIANVYSWMNQNDSALIFVEKARKLGYRNEESTSTRLNILFRAHHYEQLLEACIEAEIEHYGNQEDLFRKRLLAFSELKKYDEGIQFARANRLLLKKLGLETLYSDMIRCQNTNVVTAAMTFDFFDTSQPEQLVSAGYGFKWKECAFEGRGNFANRFKHQDIQLELDGYIPVVGRSYVYLNYGYALRAILFPVHRAGMEYYFPLLPKTDLSLGGRWMHYASSNVGILTGHLEHYAANDWFSLRPYVVFQQSATTMSMQSEMRRYGKDGQSYWGLELGYGNSPDDRYSLSQHGTFNVLDSYRIKLNKNILLRNVTLMRIGLGYTSEEILTGVFRSRYELETIFKFRLK